MNKIYYLLSTLLLTANAYAQKPSTRTATIKGNQYEWEMVWDKVKTVSQYTGRDTTIKVQNRGHLLKYNNDPVSEQMSAKTKKDLEKYLKKSVRKADMPKLLFNQKALRAHLGNCVLDKTGKIVYYEVFFFPEKDVLQLYPNEYTPEVKLFQKKMEEIIAAAPLFVQELPSPIYFTGPIILVE